MYRISVGATTKMTDYSVSNFQKNPEMQICLNQNLLSSLRVLQKARAVARRISSMKIEQAIKILSERQPDIPYQATPYTVDS